MKVFGNLVFTITIIINYPKFNFFNVIKIYNSQKMLTDIIKSHANIFDIKIMTSFMSIIKSLDNVEFVTLPAPYNLLVKLILQNPDFTALEVLIEPILECTHETVGGMYYCWVNFAQLFPPFKNIQEYATYLMDHYQEQMTDWQVFQVMSAFNTNNATWDAKFQIYTKYHYTQGLLELYNGPIYRADEEVEGIFKVKEEQRQLIADYFLQLKRQDQELKVLQKENQELTSYVNHLEHSPDPGPKYLAAQTHFEQVR